jgi:hypothetical protein
MVAGSRPAVDVGSSSTQQLFEISNFIRRQLQEQEAAAARPTEAAAAGRVGGALWPPNRAAALGSATAAGGSPSKAAAATVAAAGRLAGPSSACSSPSRKKAERQFTPAVADSIALPSYAAMRQGRAGAGVGAGTGFAAAAAAGAAAGRAGMGGNLRDSGLLGSPPRMAGGSSVGGSNGQAPQVPVGSPKRLQTTQVPRPLPGSSSEQQQQQRGVLGDNAGDTAEGWAAAPRGLSVKAPTGRAAAAAAAVWEAEAAESPRPQQMLVLEEVGNCRMSLAAAEAFGQVPLAGAAASVQLPGDLSALLRDLGLTSLELIAGGLDLEAQQKHLGSSSSGAVGKGGPAVGAGAGDRGASSSRHALVLVSEGMAGPAAATAAGMLSYSRGDGVLAGAADVDRGLQEGLPRAAVGRVYTAAGCVPATSSGEAGGGGPQPRVLKEQLKGNMCFRDHLRAAAAAASGSDS